MQLLMHHVGDRISLLLFNFIPIIIICFRKIVLQNQIVYGTGIEGESYNREN